MHGSFGGVDLWLLAIATYFRQGHTISLPPERHEFFVASLGLLQSIRKFSLTHEDYY
jgi:hypothetical protein